MAAAPRNPSPRWRRVGGGLFLVLFGGTFLYFLVPEILANLAAANWNATSCRILSSGIMIQEPRDSEEGDILYRVAVHYSYEAAARRYESRRYRFVDPFTNDRIATEAAIAEYPLSSVVSCYVDPDDPRQAVLDRSLSPFALIALLPAATAFLGLWLLVEIGVETLRRGAVPGV